MLKNKKYISEKMACIIVRSETLQTILVLSRSFVSHAQDMIPKGLVHRPLLHAVIISLLKQYQKAWLGQQKLQQI